MVNLAAIKGRTKKSETPVADTYITNKTTIYETLPSDTRELCVIYTLFHYILRAARK